MCVLGVSTEFMSAVFKRSVKTSVRAGEISSFDGKWNTRGYPPRFPSSGVETHAASDYLTLRDFRHHIPEAHPVISSFQHSLTPYPPTTTNQPPFFLAAPEHRLESAHAASLGPLISFFPRPGDSAGGQQRRGKKAQHFLSKKGSSLSG